MLTTSQLNERTKNRKNRGSGTRKTKKNGRSSESKRKRADSDLLYARKLKAPRVAQLVDLAKQMGKISASGKRMCLWSDCTTIVSIYNYDECCSRHQREWNARNMVFPID